MILPTKEWQRIEKWAADNHWTVEMARDWAFANNCIEWTVAGLVRYQPDTRQPPKYTKVSKSDT